MIELYNEDCMEGMKRYSDKYFELAIVDPPYGINLEGGHNNPNHGWTKWGERKHKLNNWNIKVTSEYFYKLWQVSKHQIIWGANNFLMEMVSVDSLNPSSWVIWNKCQRDFTLADGEMAWTSFERALRIFDLSRSEANQEIRIHPTQKPVKLYEWLLKNYAKQGDKILDTHLGSGSSAIACYNLDFSLVGFEIDKDYYEAACKRLEEHKKQQRLFA